MTLVLDSGALIALEHNHRPMWRRLKAALLDESVPVTHGGGVGQVWRGGGRQARLAKALSGVAVQPLDERLGRAGGELLSLAGLTDIVDAALALLARDGDDIVTSDPEDLALLAAFADRHVEIIPV